MKKMFMTDNKTGAVTEIGTAGKVAYTLGAIAIIGFVIGAIYVYADKLVDLYYRIVNRKAKFEDLVEKED